MENDYKSALFFIEQSSNIPLKSSKKINISVQDKLFFYSLYKQITHGPLSQNKSEKVPSSLNIIAKKKYDAYKNLGTMDKKKAMELYINKLNNIVPEWKEAVEEYIKKNPQLKSKL